MRVAVCYSTCYIWLYCRILCYTVRTIPAALCNKSIAKDSPCAEGCLSFVFGACLEVVHGGHWRELPLRLGIAFVRPVTTTTGTRGRNHPMIPGDPRCFIACSGARKVYLPTCFAVLLCVSIIRVSRNVVLKAWGAYLHRRRTRQSRMQAARRPDSKPAMQLATQPCSQPSGHAARQPVSHRIKHNSNQNAHTNQTARQLHAHEADLQQCV